MKIGPFALPPPYIQEIRVLEGVSLMGYLREGAELVDERTVRLRSDDICTLHV